MSQKDRLASQLKSVRELSESFLKSFQTPEQWTHQVHPSANHALWFAGHMGIADNFFVSVLAPEKAKEAPGFSDKFGMGSQPNANINDYPTVESVLAYMRDRREALLNLLASLSDADLTKATPPGSPDMFKDYGSVFEMAVWHEALHAGQVSVARRALGDKPIFGP